MRKFLSTNMFLALAIVFAIPATYCIRDDSIWAGIVFILLSLFNLVFYYFFQKIEEFRKHFDMQNTPYDQAQNVQERRSSLKVIRGGK